MVMDLLFVMKLKNVFRTLRSHNTLGVQNGKGKKSRKEIPFCMKIFLKIVTFSNLSNLDVLIYIFQDLSLIKVFKIRWQDLGHGKKCYNKLSLKGFSRNYGLFKWILSWM